MNSVARTPLGLSDSLDVTGEVEVFKPHGVGLGTECHKAGILPAGHDDPRVRRYECFEEAVTNSNRVEATETFQVGPHNLCPQFRHPAGI